MKSIRLADAPGKIFTYPIATFAYPVSSAVSYNGLVLLRIIACLFSPMRILYHFYIAMQIRWLEEVNLQDIYDNYYQNLYGKAFLNMKRIGCKPIKNI
jgi:hypothetical protein